MAELRVPQGQPKIANAITRSSRAWRNIALFGVGVAALMIVGCAKGIKQTNTEVGTMVGGNQAQIISEAPKQEAARQSSQVMKTKPKLVVPDVKTLEHYNPFFRSISDDSLFAKGIEKPMWKMVWMGMEDSAKPFGLSQKVIDSYSPEQRQELMRRWETAKTELRVAFLSKKGVTPATALIVHTPEEAREFSKQWQIDKESEKRNSEYMRQPSRSR